MTKKEKCPCSGPCCGDQSYNEMFEAMKARFRAPNITDAYLREIHLKWKRIAAEVN